MMFNQIFAILLLIAPFPDDHLSTFECMNSPLLREQLRQSAVRMELVDERELRYILIEHRVAAYMQGVPHMPPISAEDRLVRPEFAGDLKLLRERYRNLHDAPSLHDCERFPSRDVVNELLAFNRAYRQTVEAEQSWAWDKDAYQRALNEIDQLYRIWDLVRDARCEYYYLTVRRSALKELRERIGHEAYYRGELPPYVPFDRFRKID